MEAQPLYGQSFEAGSKFSVSPADLTFRAVIAKWSKAANWTFEPEHWTLTRDIPVGGRAEFNTDFKSAVQHLLASSLMSDMPVKPCFYSNHLVRVVAASEKCDPTKEQ